MKARRYGIWAGLAIVAAITSGALLAQAPQAIGTWVSVGDLSSPLTNGASVALPDKRTLIAGGALADGTLTDAVTIYDSVDDSATAAGTLTSARADHTATLLKDGRVLVVGGMTADGLISSDIEIFDPATGTSAVVALLPEPRNGHVAAALPNGNVLIAGGATVDGTMLQTAVLFDPETSGVSSVPGHLHTARVHASATTMLDGRVLVAGGSNGTTELASAEIYDRYSQSFSMAATQMSVGRQGHSAVLLPDNGGVLVAGGTSNGVAQAGVDLFLPAVFPDPFSYGEGEFTATGAMTAARSRAVAGPTSIEGYAFAAAGGGPDAEVYRFATIKTDKDDYPPGELAVITGSGWQANEEVTLTFQEDPAVHDDYVLKVKADGSGNIYWNKWAPEAHDANVRFYLLAQGAASRAQMTFTDSVTSVTVSSPTDAAPQTITSLPATVTVSFSYVTSTTGATSGTADILGTGLSATKALTPGTQTDSINVTVPAGTPNGTYNLKVTVTNSTGSGSNNKNDNQNGAVIINVPSNTAPSANFTAGPTSVDENTSTEHTFSFSITDSDAGDSWSFASGYPTCGVGGNLVAASASIDNTIKTGSFKCTFPDGQTSAMATVRVQDAAAAVSSEATRNVGVANVAPTATLSNNGPVAEGGQVTVGFSNQLDPSSADTAAGFHFAFACDGSSLNSATYVGSGASGSMDCTFGNSGTPFVRARIIDKDGGYTEYETAVTVTNVAPTATLSNNGPIAEGGQVMVSFSNQLDPSSADTAAGFHYAFACDGSALDSATYATSGTSGSTDCPFGDSGTPSVRARIIDKDGGYTEYETAVTVNNVAPTATLSNGGSVAEGSPVNVSFSSPQDPSSADTAAGFRYVFACDGSSLDAATYAGSGASASTSCTFPDNGTATVVARILDKDGGFNEYTAQFTVTNVNPTATLSNGGTVTEGSLVTVSLSNPQDPSSADIAAGFHYAFACDGSALDAATYANSGTSDSKGCPFDDNGTFTVRARIFDKDGGFTEYTTPVTVTNAPPTATLSNNGPINEGGQVTVSFSNQLDPSSADTAAGFHYAFACDGSSLNSATYSGSGASGSTDCTFGDNGTPSVRARIIDKDGGYTEYETAVTVTNVAPTATLSNNGPVAEGSPVTVSFSNQLDPSGADTAAGFRYAFACDGSALNSATYAGSGATGSTSCTFGDNGTPSVRARIIDKDGGFTEYTSQVTVTNVAPSKTSSSLVFNPYTGKLDATVSFSDPGWLDTATSVLNWAGAWSAGTPTAIGPLAAAGTLTGQFSGSYTFAGCIAGAISVRVSDDDGGSFDHELAAANALGVYSVAFVAPLKDGVRNIVKLGNVIPVKVRVLDCHGLPLMNRTLKISVVAGATAEETAEGAEEVPISVSAADSTGTMRPADGHFIYNMSTKGMAVGLPFTIIIRDGSQVIATAVIETKK